MRASGGDAKTSVAALPASLSSPANKNIFCELLLTRRTQLTEGMWDCLFGRLRLEWEGLGSKNKNQSVTFTVIVPVPGGGPCIKQGLDTGVRHIPRKSPFAKHASSVTDCLSCAC
jgi:hypothetical protein